MSTITTDCPHCGAQKNGFAVAGYSFCKQRNFVMAHCQECWMPIIAQMWHPAGGVQSMPDPLKLPPSYNGWEIAKIWPAMPVASVPEFLPDAAARAFRQGEANFRRIDMEEASAGSYRRALDVGTKEIASAMPNAVEFEGKQLNNRIDMLRKHGRLTPELAEWSHRIKGLGNEAMHDLDGITREELTALRGFTELVLTYLFTLPGMLKDRKEAAEPKS